MKKLLATSAIALVLALPTLAQAQMVNEADNLAAAGSGAAAGATVGAIIGGPVGAIIGGFAGATLGAAVVPDEVVAYTVANPVQPIVVDGELVVGAALPETVTLTPIPDSPEYGYIYANGRAYIVALDNREVVYSPGYVVSQDIADYVISNPVEPVTLEGELVAGYVLPGEIALTPVQTSPGFSYIYVDGRPVIVDTQSRAIIWAQ